MVSALAIGPKVYGFKPGRGYENPQQAFESEVKLSASFNILRHVKGLHEYEKVTTCAEFMISFCQFLLVWWEVTCDPIVCRALTRRPRLCLKPAHTTKTAKTIRMAAPPAALDLDCVWLLISGDRFTENSNWNRRTETIFHFQQEFRWSGYVHYSFSVET
jgi:hypothetical protein